MAEGVRRVGAGETTVQRVVEIVAERLVGTPGLGDGSEGERHAAERPAGQRPAGDGDASPAHGGRMLDLARREARELVAAVMEAPRSWPSYAADELLSLAQRERIMEAAERRRRGAPLAYAVRTAPFRHLLLHVDERVLIPRPETEYLIDRLLARGLDHRGALAVDVGTGSGAIALALASEFDFARVVATDVSSDAIAVARLNASRCATRRDGPPLRAALEFRLGDALAPLHDLQGSVELLVSNPPYIAFDELASLPAGVRDWEPSQSLACADDGLAMTRAVIGGGGRLLRRGGTLALETDTRRTQRVAGLVRDDGAFDEVQVVQDLTGRDRFVLARRRAAG